MYIFVFFTVHLFFGFITAQELVYTDSISHKSKGGFWCITVTHTIQAALQLNNLNKHSSVHNGPSVRNIHHPECQVPQLGDAFERK
jgi:hypothetical protein